jgi:hypothetical protein
MVKELGKRLESRGLGRNLKKVKKTTHRKTLFVSESCLKLNADHVKAPMRRFDRGKATMRSFRSWENTNAHFPIKAAMRRF